MKEDTVMVRVTRKLKKKLKVKAAKEGITMSRLLDKILKDNVWK